MSTTRSSRVWLLLLSLLVVLADRVTKWMVVQKIALGDHVVVIPHIFAISHVENIGAAFSLFNDSASPARVRWLLLTFSLVGAAAVFGVLMRLGGRLTA